MFPDGVLTPVWRTFPSPYRCTVHHWSCGRLARTQDARRAPWVYALGKRPEELIEDPWNRPCSVCWKRVEEASDGR